MLCLYTSFKCKKCKKDFVLLTEQFELSKNEGKYISCPHCGSRYIKKEKAADNLKECMQANSYFRNKRGAIEQKQ